MHCFPQLLITSAAETTPVHVRTLTSLSRWQTKEGHRTGRHLEQQRAVGFLLRPEKPRMPLRRSLRGSPPFGQLEQFSMNRGIYGIWQSLTRNLVDLTMLGATLTTP